MELLFELWLYWFISVYGYYPTPQEFPPAIVIGPDGQPRPALTPAGDPFAPPPPPPPSLPPIVVPPPQ